MTSICSKVLDCLVFDSGWEPVELVAGLTKELRQRILADQADQRQAVPVPAHLGQVAAPVAVESEQRHSLLDTAEDSSPATVRACA